MLGLARVPGSPQEGQRSLEMDVAEEMPQVSVGIMPVGVSADCNPRWKREAPIIIPKYCRISKYLGFYSRSKARVKAVMEKACCWPLSCYLLSRFHHQRENLKMTFGLDYKNNNKIK